MSLQDDFRRCGRDDEHEPHAWASWFTWSKGTAVTERELHVTYWCDGYPADYNRSESK